jgi:hypothetical protein
MLLRITSRGLAMRLFNKGKPKDLWDEVIQWPIEDLEAARRIRDICNAAIGSAEKVSSQMGAAKTKANKDETERYKRASKAAMQIAIKISDDLLRDAALRQIVALSVKANELRTAAVLFRGIQAVSIKEDVLNEHPALRQAVT